MIVLSMSAQAKIYLDIERYPDSGLPSFVTTCATRLECYKKFQYAIKTGKIRYCKKITMIENNHAIWQIDFVKNMVWYDRQQILIWGE